MSIRKFAGTIVLVVVAFIILGLSTRAEGAEDKKNYPGMLCHMVYSMAYTSYQYYPSDGNGYPNEATRDAYWHGTVQNEDTSSSRQFGCPVVGDCSANYSTGHWVYVEDRSASAISCYVCVRDASWTASGGCGSGASSSGSAGARERIQPGSLTTSYTYSSRFIQCVLPARDGGEGGSAIVAYGMDENC